MLQIDILTLFTEAFSGYLQHSIIGRAIERQFVDVRLHDIRSFTHDKHGTADDYPYGGGAGMIMKPEPVFEAVESVKSCIDKSDCQIILLTPQGRIYTQEIAEKMASQQNIILICGHYEGMDERVAEHCVTDEISIGDYLLSGGETAAMVIVDSLVRLLPGAIGSQTSLHEESHVGSLLEYPQYTRPPEFRGWQVPEVLLSGNHKEIALWRRQQSILRTAKRRPDLLKKASLTEAEYRMLKSAGLQNN
ncbi:MAG: tRNA (guanosine(37)-N1)-methyltransferase TrmD [Dehalococcoidia bacterium]|nr:tRNA (guanosine(37)-N1)-methyltransferase TrmD [Dehalococcoidia bacterium]